MENFPIHHVDSMFGPSRMARYRAGVDARPGCGYSSDAAVYGYDNFVVPDVKRAHPDWTADQVTREALILFNLRFSENIASLQQEQKGESGMTVWREEMSGGERTLVIHGGEHDGYTLEKLWGQTEHYDRDIGVALTGSREEYLAQKRIQQAILDGEATSSASIIGHPESVKLIQTFRRGSEGLYYSEQIDLEGITGRTMTFSEAKAVMGALYHDHRHYAKMDDARHDHFMITEGVITASEVKTIVRAVVLTSREAKSSREQPKQSDLIKQTDSTHDVFTHGEAVVTDCVRGNMLTDTSRTVFRDSGEAISKMVTLLRDKEKRKEATDRLLNISVVQRIRKIFEKGDQVIDNNNAAALLLSINQKSEEGALHPKVQPERLTLEKIREKPKKIVKTIQTRHAEMRKSMGALLVAAETKVALGVAPVLLAILAKEQPKPIRAVEKSIKRHKKELRIKNKELGKKVKRERKNLQKVQPLKTERVEPLRAAKERKGRVRRGKEKGIKIIAAASEKIPSAPKKRERREKRKMRQTVEKSLRRHKKKELKRESQKDSVKVQPLIEKKRSIQKKEREAVAGIVFGWVVWMILTRKDSETPKNNFKRSHPDVRRGETLRRQEVTSWILLSIIYYLTAIREQGMHNYPIKKKRRTLPKKGIIFSFAS